MLFLAVKYPKGEEVWTSYFNKNDELVYLITSKPTRDFYLLYELVDGSFKKLGRAASPLDLEERFMVEERMGVP